MQIYLLTVIYLIVVSLFLLLDSYREHLTFLIRYRHLLLTNVKLRVICFGFGVLLSLLNLFFPSSPGPKFLGDLLPSISLFFSSFFFLALKEEKIGVSTIYGRGKHRGLILLGVAILHFLLPNCVIL